MNDVNKADLEVPLYSDANGLRRLMRLESILSQIIETNGIGYVVAVLATTLRDFHGDAVGALPDADKWLAYADALEALNKQFVEPQEFNAHSPKTFFGGES